MELKSMRSALESQYRDKLKLQLKDQLAIENIMLVPKVVKIVLNIGAKDAVGDSRIIGEVQSNLGKIAGQLAVKTLAKKSIAGFKLREGMAIGSMVTLRGSRMYYFLEKLINIVLPSVRDFQGVSDRLDGNGNYNLGFKDWMVFPEIDYDKVDKSRGLNITICTSAKRDSDARALLSILKLPFKKKN